MSFPTWLFWGDMYAFVRPLLHKIDPEKAHGLAIAGLKSGLHPRFRADFSERLHAKVAGLDFSNPLGMAAGFDKNAEVPGPLLELGFGFCEIGSVTPRPQEGNPKPRLFRLTEDKGVINRMGFNNKGAEAALSRFKARAGRPGIVGINIGANKDSEDRIADYATMARLMAPYASYLAVNVSSPNTPGLRALQDENALVALIEGVIEARDEAAPDNPPPIFLKVAPDLEQGDIDDIARIAIDKSLDALIVSNTTIARPDLKSRHAHEAGGLSGEPLREMAQQRVRDFRKATGGAIPLVGVGGISTAEHAWDRIRAGASLVQLYSAMVFHGPGLGGDIARGLERLMVRDGFSSIAEAVGSE